MDCFLVSVRSCPSYDPAVVDEALAALLQDLGGVEAFVKPGWTILLKPNLLAGEPPERAITTHPEVVRAAVTAFRAMGAQVVVGDSPGIGSCRGVAEKTGVGAAARAAGGTICRFDRVATLGKGGGRHFPMATEVGEADLVVNLPKLKTHGMMALSGAVKNLFGCVVGLRKPGYHLECQGTRELAGLLLDLAAAVAPGLTVMDAVVAMDGPGPRNGRPCKTGLLIGARDPLAVDFVTAELLGVSTSAVPILRLAEERGLAAADPARRAIVGIDADAYRTDFQLPPHLRQNDFNVPRFLLGFVKRGLTARPIVRKNCAACGACAAVCPAKAIEDGHRGLARIIHKQCIRCYCCEEMCPHGAIALRQGLIGRLWPWG